GWPRSPLRSSAPRPERTRMSGSASRLVPQTGYGRPPGAVGLIKAFFADQRDEAAWHRPQNRRSLGAAYDELQLLSPASANRNGEPAARLELLVERDRHLGRSRRDCDRAERRVLRQAHRPVADVDVHALVSRGVERFAGVFGEIREALDRV